MGRFWWRGWWLVVWAVLAMTAHAQDGAKPISLLVIGNTTEHRVSPEVFEQIHTAGFNMQFLELRHRAGDWGRLDELIPQADVIVMMGAGLGTSEGTLDEKHQHYFKLIDDYAKQGGGVLYLCAERYVPSFVAGGLFLDRWGVNLGREYIVSTAGVSKTAWKVSYLYTDAVKPSPVSEGVKGLWVPVTPPDRLGRGSAREALGIALQDKAWQVVVSAGPSAQTLGLETPVPPVRQRTVANRIASDPPVWAVREYGKGRLGISAVTYGYLLGRAALSTLDGIVWDRGTEGKASDGKTLFLNTLRWLAEPSLKAGRTTFGDNPELYVPSDQEPILAPTDWSKHPLNTAPLPALPGLIGARTAYSGGRGTVAEWKEAAVNMGLRWLVFLEDFPELTREEFATLKKECLEQSDDRILLLPGFAIENFIGMKTFYFDPHLPYPEAAMLAPDGKRFGDGVAQAPKNWHGQLAYLRMHYIYGMCGRQAVTGWYDFAHMPVPASDCGTYDTVPVITANANKLVEESAEVFRQTCRDKQWPQPVALDFVTDPLQLGESGLWRTEARFENLTDFAAYFSGSGYSGRMGLPPQMYVTNGPRIVTWQATGGFDYSYTNRDEWVWQNALRKFYLHVESDAGLAEVKVYDGTRLYRRFDCQGKTSFEAAMDVDVRDQQRELTLVVTDRAGKQAFSGMFKTKNHFLQQVNCSDRNNQLANGLARRRDGSVFKYAFLAAVPDKRTSFMSVRPSACFSNDERLGLGAFDGPAPADYPSVKETLLLDINEAHHEYEQTVFQGKWGEEENGSHYIASCYLADMDALIGDRLVDSVFADNVDVIHVWNTLWRLKPRQFSTWTQRRWVFRPRPDEPLILNLWEYTLTLKKDVTYREGAALGLVGPSLAAGESTLWSIGKPGDSTELAASGEYPTRGKVTVDEAFGPGAWVACLGGASGGAIVYSLTPGLRVVGGGGHGTVYFQIGLPPDKAPTRAGESVTLRVAVVGVPRLVPGYSDVVAKADPVATPGGLKTSLGIGGTPRGFQVTWAQGREEADPWFCRVAAEHGVVRGRFEQAPELMAPVPVLVTGLNPRWTAVLAMQGGAMRGLGQVDGEAPVMIDPQLAAKDVFIGHPVQADDPNLTISLVQTGDTQWRLELHNPTAAPISTRVRTVDGWDRFRIDETLNLPEGSSTVLTVGK